MCPPSSIGIGKRFKMPKFIEIKAVINKSKVKLFCAAFEVISVMVIIPPKFFASTSPLMSFIIPLMMSVEA